MIEKLEYWWRHRIVYPLLRLIFHNPRKDSPIEIQTVNSVLFLRYDRIGDMIVTTPIFQSLKQLNPALKIGVFASKTNAEIIRYNPYVDTVYVLHSNWVKLITEILKARRNKYEVVLNLIFNRTTSGGILSNILSPPGIKIGQGDEKYRFYFNRILKISRNTSHMLETLVLIIKEVFDIKLIPDQLKYNIFVNEETRNKVTAYLTAYNLRPRQYSAIGKSFYVVFNLSANDSVRRISAKQAYSIGDHLGSKTSFRTLLLHAPNDSLMLSVKQELVKNSRCLSFPDQGNASLLEIAVLIEGALAVITPDTSIVHFASATKTPVVGFYTQMQDVHEWLPHQVNNRLVVSSKYEPTSAIPIPEMINAIDDFMMGLNREPMNK
ncbi:MAG: glycosyltransferase family 9 protein [Bacteroidota bacterium]|jgi:ADP-heptose:LPS heptosyltransferase